MHHYNVSVLHFAHLWSHFSINFHIWPTKSKLRASSTTWRCFCNVLVPVRGWKTAKNMTKIANDSIFCLFSPPYRHQNITKTSPCCRGGSKLHLVGHMWKLVEKWFQKWAKCKTTSNFNTASTSTCLCSRIEIFGTLKEWVCLLWPHNIVRYTDSPLIVSPILFAVIVIL